jgi:hypothetical protein
MVTRSLCLLLLLALSASAQTPRIPPPESVNRNGLVGRWLWDGGVAPPVLRDWRGILSGGFVSSPSWGNYSSRVSLFVSPYKFARIPHSASQQLSVFTLSCWGRANSKDTSFKGLICKYTWTGNQLSYELALNAATSPTPILSVSSSGANSFYAVSPVSFPLSTWTHLAASYQNPTAKLYVNGQLVISTNISVSVFTNSTAALVLGARNDGQQVSDFFDGQITDCRIYNRALSADEIKRIYRGVQ